MFYDIHFNDCQIEGGEKLLREDAEKIQTAKILINDRVAPDIFHLVLETPKLAHRALPGQFVMIKVAPGPELPLRRPFGIHRLSVDTGRVEIIYQVVGKGTDILRSIKPEGHVEILGPLGNGFRLDQEKKIGLVGGGIGIAPLLYAAEKAVEEGREIVSFLGARTGDCLIALDKFEHLGGVFVVTDDGSLGKKGLVCDPLEKYLEKQSLDLILGCGPLPMLRALAGITGAKKIPAQLSLEQRMACGVGACLGCALPVKADTPERFVYKRVCYDGPVFPADEVLFALPEKNEKPGGCSCGKS